MHKYYIGSEDLASRMEAHIKRLDECSVELNILLDRLNLIKSSKQTAA